MIYIAHRGNINGPVRDRENSPAYLLEAIANGFHIETDLWFIHDTFFLGHDAPQYEISIDFLLSVKTYLFCHCKNIAALYHIINYYPEIECFFHDQDDCVLTSKKHIWNFPGKELHPLSICVMPERVNQTNVSGCYGVCTDFPIKMKNEFYSTNPHLSIAS
jgi:hypothetical protein